MKLKCLIVDDDSDSAAYAKYIVLQCPELQLLGVETDAAVALLKIKKQELKPDIILLDIMMPSMDGMEFASAIGEDAGVIFITGDPTRAVEGFEKGGIDYIVKPLTTTRLTKAVKKMQQWHLGKRNFDELKSKYLVLQYGKKGQYKSFNPDEIIFFEGALNNIVIHMTDGKHYTINQTLTAMEAQLNGLAFLRIHKTFIISLTKITAVTGNNVTLIGNYHVRIGPKYKAIFLDRLKDSGRENAGQ